MPEQDKKNPQEIKPADSVPSVNTDSTEKVMSDVPPLEQIASESDTADVPKTDADIKDTPLDRVSTSEDSGASDEDLTPFDDEKTDQAIDEIVAKEGDDLLAAQDAVAFGAGAVNPPKKRGFFRRKWVRFVLFLIVLAGIAAVMTMPKTRYLVLNTAGVRSSSSVTVVDSTTQLPLKGVTVSLSGKEIETDSEGAATFSNLKLGPAKLAITQVGFEEIERDIVIGWGSNPLGSFSLKSTGVQYVIEVRDYLSDLPLEGVEATDGATTAISDKNGKVTLSLSSPVVVKDGITLNKSGYRSQKLTLGADPKKETKATMVLARKAVFVTKQSGKYDVYKSDIDGQNREVVLPGTGHENSNISLVVSPDGNRAALVSTRDNKRDGSGFLLSSIVLINIDNSQTTTIAEGSQIQLIDWIGTRLIYQIVSSATSANRYTVVSYNYSDNTRLQLAAAASLPR